MISKSTQADGASAAEDIMRVERSATSDGRLLLYFTFESAPLPHAVEDGNQSSNHITSGGER